jgi:MtN3 and saliva related transmembrane protein
LRSDTTARALFHHDLAVVRALGQPWAMDIATTTGLVAGFLTTIAFVPQVAKIWRARSARDLSLHTFATFTAGVALWLAYGILRNEPPIIVWNAITLALAATILGMKLRFG